MGVIINGIDEVIFYDRKRRPVGYLKPSCITRESDVMSYDSHSPYGFEKMSKLVVEGYTWAFDPYLGERVCAATNVWITKVIFNDPATIVLWSDDTKTVVKRQEDELMYDPEKGLAMAIAKKYFGNKRSYYSEIKKWMPKEETVPHVSPKTVTYSNDITASSYESLAKAINTMGERLRKMAEQGK